jgi:hypothetical protein
MLQQIEHEAPLTGPEDSPSIEPRAPGHSVKILRSHPKTARALIAETLHILAEGATLVLETNLLLWSFSPPLAPQRLPRHPKHAFLA